jgi:hypothetical protein
MTAVTLSKIFDQKIYEFRMTAWVGFVISGCGGKNLMPGLPMQPLALIFEWMRNRIIAGAQPILFSDLLVLWALGRTTTARIAGPCIGIDTKNRVSRARSDQTGY